MKIEDLKIGKWYIRKNDILNSGAFKFKGVDKKNSNICYSERIWSNNKYSSDSGSLTWLLSDISEISLEEIQKYLPKGHPDLLVKSEYITLNDIHVGKLVSLYWFDYYYDKVLVAKEDNRIYLLNNCKSNSDSHSDKSLYRYSLRYDYWDNVNTFCTKIKLLEKTTNIPDYVKCTNVSGLWSGIFIKDKIYKRHNFSTDTIIELIGENHKPYTVSYKGITLSFEPSTKEEFSKQNIKENVIPEYVECINPLGWTNTIKSNNNNLIFHKDFITFSGKSIEKYYYEQPSQFKISSKEDYELQNKPKETMFKKGDYIVTLKGEFRGNCAKENYCFKQRRDSQSIYPELDLSRNRGNGHDAMSFDKKNKLKDWRYATKEEAEHYEKVGKPYDVTILNRLIPIIGEYYVKGIFIFIHVDSKDYKCNNIALDTFCSIFYQGNAHINNSNENPDRLATPEEKQWLEACIKANKFVPKEEALKPKYEYEVVHCTTQKEWDFVTEKLNCRWKNGNFNDYKNESCIDIQTKSYSKLSFFIHNKFKIYSFKEWCSKFGHTYTERIVDTTNSQPISDIEKAKRDYPIGTRYICPFFKKEYVVKQCNSTYTQRGDGYIDGGNGQGYLKVDGKWAEIISTPEKVVTTENAKGFTDISDLVDKFYPTTLSAYGISPIDYYAVGVDLETGQFSYEYPQFNKRNPQQQITEQIIEVKQLKPITINK